MRTEIFFQMASTHRDDFRIRGFWFGHGEETACIVGPMRGDEVQQQYVAGLIVKALTQIELRGGINTGKSILVIPSCNPFSMNVSHRFWSMDDTDINRMFPGYDKGETTQRIAAAVFGKIERFKYGMQLASYYMPGDFIPHVRMLKTGYEDIDDARLFGFEYVATKDVLPFDTTLLNYNWQLWETKAFSVYTGRTRHVDEGMAQQTKDAILRFLCRVGAIKYMPQQPGYQSKLIHENDLKVVKSPTGGIFRLKVKPGQIVERGQTLAIIIDPFLGEVKADVTAPCRAEVFFCYHKSLVVQNALLFKLIDDEWDAD